MRVLFYGGVNLTELIPMEETEFEKKAKAFRAKMLEIAKPYISTIIFVAIISFMLNWTFDHYGEHRFWLASVVLIATLLFTRGRS